MLKKGQMQGRKKSCGAEGTAEAVKRQDEGKEAKLSVYFAYLIPRNPKSTLAMSCLSHTPRWISGKD